VATVLAAASAFEASGVDVRVVLQGLEAVSVSRRFSCDLRNLLFSEKRKRQTRVFDVLVTSKMLVIPLFKIKS